MCGHGKHSGNHGDRKEKEKESGCQKSTRFQLQETISLEIKHTPHHPEIVRHCVPFQRTDPMLSVFNLIRKEQKLPGMQQL